MHVRLGAGPVSWGVDFADDPKNPPWQDVFDGIAASGVSWTELGPLGYLPEDGASFSGELERRALSVAGSFVFQPLHDESVRLSVIDIARRTCGLIAAVGGRYLVIVGRPDEVRAAAAGRSGDAARLDEDGWGRMLQTILAVAAVAHDEFGLRPVLHPHAGTYVEFEDEIDRLLADTSGSELGLCVDTGHCEYADVDPAALLARNQSRVDYLHFKDVDAAVLARVRRERIDFWKALTLEVFCPLGAGSVDFDAFAKGLREVGFDGWGTIEQDRRPNSKRNPLDDLRASIDYLTEVGFANAR